MARFPDGANAEDLGLLHPGDDEFLQELLGSETPSLGTDPWAAGQGAWPSLPPLEQAQSSASAGREASGDAGEQKSGRRQQQHDFDHQQLQSPRNGGGGGSDGAPKSARQRRLEINRRSQTLYRERQKEKSRRMETANLVLSARVAELEAQHAQALAHKTSLAEQLRATTAQLTAALQGSSSCSKCGGKGRSSSGGSASPSRGEAAPNGSANLGPAETELYVAFLTALRGTPVSVEQVQSMTAAEIKNVDRAREYVSAAAPLLFQGGEIEGTPANQRLMLMASYYWEVGVMFWSDRNGALRVLLEDWEEQLIGESGPPDRQTWHNAAAVMRLTDEQKRGIQAAWRVCMSQSKRVLQQRELALAELDMRGLSLKREGDFSLEMRKQGDAADGLQRCWDQANSIMGNFHVAVRNEGRITPVQLAKGCIAVAPWYLDLLALADVVVEGMGETDATIRLMPGMDWTSQLGLSSGPSAQ